MYYMIQFIPTQEIQTLVTESRSVVAWEVRMEVRIIAQGTWVVMSVYYLNLW